MSLACRWHEQRLLGEGGPDSPPALRQIARRLLPSRRSGCRESCTACTHAERDPIDRAQRSVALISTLFDRLPEIHDRELVMRCTGSTATFARSSAWSSRWGSKRLRPYVLPAWPKPRPAICCGEIVLTLRA